MGILGTFLGHLWSQYPKKLKTLTVGDLLLGAQSDTLGVILEQCSQIGAIMLICWLHVLGLGKMNENGAPKGGGVDMQSINACACFVRIGMARGSWRKTHKKDNTIIL